MKNQEAHRGGYPRGVGDCMRIAIGFGIAVLLVNQFLLMGIMPPCQVDGPSMEPTLVAGERIFIARVPFWFREPRRWEIVVCRSPANQTLCIKRVVGLPGETVQIRDGAVYTGDQLLVPPSAQLRYSAKPAQGGGISSEYHLGRNEYFLLGDNSSISEDSRVWEPPAVPVDAIVGKPLIARD